MFERGKEGTIYIMLFERVGITNPSESIGF